MDTKTVLISVIEFAPEEVSLRPAPSEKDKDYDKFLELKNDIGRHGLNNLFSVRETNGKFYVIDGYRRLTALKQLEAEGKLHPTLIGPDGKGAVTVQIRADSEWDALATQLSANYHRKKTLSSLEIKAMQKIMTAMNLTLKELSDKVGMGEVYVSNLLKLQYLPEIAKIAIDEGKMSLANAIQLNKLPDDVIENYVESAMTKPVDEFTTEISAVLNELKKNRKGEKVVGFVAIPKLRDKKDLETALERARQVFDSEKSDFNRGYLEALTFIFQMDEPTVAAAKAEWEKKEKEKIDNKAKRSEERDEKKVAAAKELLEKHGVKVSG